ncbi:MAG: DUF3667 domain-containing protein [Aquaticitalea sp.]
MIKLVPGTSLFMTTNECLNCNTNLVDNYCSSCGQKADTRRISFRNFVFNDILHGTFSIERGMLFTAKQALLRPGRAALDYISGKRKRYYNVFLLALVVFGLILFLRHFYDVLANAKGDIQTSPDLPNEASKKLDQLISEKSKLFVFLFVPMSALASFVLFRRKKLNLSEHFILSGMMLLGILLISAAGNLLFYFDLLMNSNFVANILDYGTPTVAILYIGYGYCNAFADDYSRWGMLYRIPLFFLLLVLQAYIILFFVIGFITDWRFGTVTVSPFG